MHDELRASTIKSRTPCSRADYPRNYCQGCWVRAHGCARSHPGNVHATAARHCHSAAAVAASSPCRSPRDDSLLYS
eukprot:1159772-Pelagomonas_calceolata.AAC.1